MAFTCAELGLLAPSDVKALTVFGTTTPTEILFSVTADSTGVADSAVDNSDNVGGDVYASTGNGQNSQRVERRALGIAPGGQLDALTTVQRSAQLQLREPLHPHAQSDERGQHRAERVP